MSPLRLYHDWVLATVSSVPVVTLISDFGSLHSHEQPCAIPQCPALVIWGRFTLLSAYWLSRCLQCVLQGSVSKQLDALCDLSPVLAAARFPKYRKAAAAEQRRLRLENSRLRVQLARSQAEVERLQQMLSGLLQ
jgi:hypothetical protein